MIDRYFSQRTRHNDGPGMPPVGLSVFVVPARRYEKPAPYTTSPQKAPYSRGGGLAWHRRNAVH